MSKMEIDMNPTVLVTQQPLKSSKLPKLKKLLVSFVILVVITVLAYLIPKLIPQTKKSTDKPAQAVFQANSPTLKLKQTIVETFGGQAKYQEIVKLTNLTASEKDINKKYELYKMIFSKALKAYQQTKNPQFTFVLYQIRNYTLAFPQFKEADFKIPK